MARFLVTGAAGFIGSHLVEALRAAGHDVVGVDRRPGADVVGDLLTLDLAPLLDGVEYVVHLAGQPGVRESWSQFPAYLAGNLQTTQRLLESLRDRPLKKFVLASTSSVYGEVPMPAREDGPAMPVSPYGLTKLAAEKLCDLYGRTAGIPWVALRYFTVYGPRQRPDMAFSRWFNAALDGEPIQIYGDGSQLRDFTYVADAVTATQRAALNPVVGVPINVGGGSAVTVREAIRLIAAITGRPIRIRQLPPAPGDMRETRADTERLWREVGFRPSTPLEEGLWQQYRWHLAQRA
ncbi:NAD-dependent epimerase/dehydratase family protein [Symbiobacterium thermophilum]|uniref:UDP-glucose 4-epimerase n=2 Tax=Symbiobacterium thermophilum TaxID=2734 RepID=Q67RC7_SYMTH|nr:NAD-dependent epimerase/dehydratase family protein [Symbiobacterium thermophilum]BAD39766.1 UDP-glucose 4-epimerase [Symbiobacterium thermophilum IAM 14863]